MVMNKKTECLMKYQPILTFIQLNEKKYVDIEFMSILSV